MKKQFTYAIGKKVFTMVLALAIVLCSSVKSFASANTPDSTAKAADITYKGLRDQYLVFKVDYKNELAQPFQLVIKNDLNEVLYRKTFDERPLNTDVLLSEVPENCKLTFVIVSNKKDYSQSFSINTKVRTVEEFIVKGL